MRITVEANGTLRPRLPVPVELIVPEDTFTVGRAIERLGLGRATGIVIMVNGRLGHWDTELDDGDVVELVPTIGGG